MIWFNLEGTKTSHSHSLNSLHPSCPSAGLRECKKTVKLVSWDSLLGQKRKGENPNNNKSSDTQHNCSPPTSSWAVALVQLSPCLYSNAYNRPYSVKYPFGQLGSAFVAVSPHNYFCPCSLLTAGVGRGAEKPLTLCKHYIARTKMSAG